MNDLPFQFLVKPPAMQSMRPQEASMAQDARDRELEDYIGRLEARIAKLEQTLAAGLVPRYGSITTT